MEGTPRGTTVPTHAPQSWHESAVASGSLVYEGFQVCADDSQTHTNAESDGASSCAACSEFPMEDGSDEGMPSDLDRHPPDQDRYQTGNPDDDPHSYDHESSPWAKNYNSRPENGNCGWAFANGGARAKNKAKQDYIDKVMKRVPAQILGLAECDQKTEEMLRAPGEPKGNTTAPAGSIEAVLNRESFQYLTIRGSEKQSVLLGVRKRNCRSLTLKDFLVLNEGTYRAGTTKASAVTRALIAEVSTSKNVGFLGNTHTVMVVHLHFTVAKGASGKKSNKQEFINLFRRKILEHNVKVVMGDFNMAFWEVTGWVRRSTPPMTIDLAAWYGWKSFDGIPSSDSCGIWILDTPGLYTLLKDVKDINEEGDDERSLLITSKTKTQFPIKEDAGGWARFDRNGGPGQPLNCYHPKTVDDTATDKRKKKLRIPPLQQIRESLTPSQQSAACNERYMPGKVTETGHKECFRAKQVPLHYEGFCSEKFGQQKGSHYPICVMTGNNSCRQPQQHMARQVRNTQKKQLWWTKVAHKEKQEEATRPERHMDQPDTDQGNYNANSNSWRKKWHSREYRDVWRSWRPGAWTEERNHLWEKEKENRAWDHRMPQKVSHLSRPPQLPPQPPAESSVLSPADDSAEQMPDPMVPGMPVPPLMPVRSNKTVYTPTPEGFSATTMSWNCYDGQIVCDSFVYAVPPWPNMYYQNPGDETLIQPLSHAPDRETGELAVSR